jgi:hypothetical protein
MDMKASIRKTTTNIGLGLAIIAAAVIFGLPVYAQQPKIDLTGAGHVAQPSTDDAATKSDLIRVSATNAPAAAAQLADPLPLILPFGSPEVSVRVDRTYCATGGVQCSGPGLTFAAAANNNRNPIRLGIQVVNSNGSPVTNLTDAEINFINPFVPAGGTAIVQFSCGNCFQNAGNGLYAIFVNPANNANWKSGSYFAQVQVKVGSNTYRELVQISIPF